MLTIEEGTCQLMMVPLPGVHTALFTSGFAQSSVLRHFAGYR